MRRKNGDIVRYSAAELEALRAAGRTGSDWSAAAALPVPDGGDPDDALAAVEWATMQLPMPTPKVHTNLRLDADVMAFFRAQGRGYQTRINAVLRAYVAHFTQCKSP